MYKCTECGAEFENKPDYCDCGNDEFVLTVEEKPEVKIAPEAVKIKEKPMENIQSKNGSVYYNNVIAREPYKLPVAPYAIIVFVLCIIFSLLVLFVWKPVKETAETVSEIIEKVENKSIPSIDKLWKNPTPQPIQTEPAQTVQKQEPVKKVAVVPLVKKPVQQKNVTVNKPVVKQQSKPAATTNKTQQKPAANTQSVNKAQEDAKKAQEEAAKKAAAEAAKKAQEAKAKAEAEALAAAERARKNAQAKQELHSYKINLRNAIGQKIDFTRVIGDGDCAVTFKVDSSGRLVNRAFAKQSSNITLNNAVYNAVMAVPSFNPPPSLYNNETLRLTIKFNNGNFAITLE
jgi:outer membrane biosynthesis protein TonB